MKFSTVTLLATIVAVAAAQSSSGDGIITISPIPGSTESTSPTATGPATTSSTTGIPVITTSGSVTVPTVTKTTTGPPTGPPTPSPTKPNGGSALSSTPAKMLLAIGGGAAVLAQFL
ncbi:hypothetical protein CPB97_005172 [Podila verticillata]|nr:hypothetical protein CPB97_005172 [Podila verticillata]